MLINITEIWNNFLEILPAGVITGAGLFIFIKDRIKSVIEKSIEKEIETCFEKQLEKYKDSLERKTKAYELKLNREFSAYQDILDYLSFAYIKIYTICDLLLDTNADKKRDTVLAKDLLGKLVEQTQQYKELLYKNLIFVGNEEISNKWKDIVADITKYCVELYKILRTINSETEMSAENRIRLNTIKNNVETNIPDCMDLIKNKIVELIGEDERI